MTEEWIKYERHSNIRHQYFNLRADSRKVEATQCRTASNVHEIKKIYNEYRLYAQNVIYITSSWEPEARLGCLWLHRVYYYRIKGTAFTTTVAEGSSCESWLHSYTADDAPSPIM